MIYILNIVSPTKGNDTLYKHVSVNTWPIVWVSDSIAGLWENEDLKKTLKEIIRSKRVQDNAIVYCRIFDDNIELIKNETFKLSEKIKDDICQQ